MAERKTMKKSSTTKKVVEENKVSVEKTAKKFEQSDGILCHSIVQGKLYMIGDKTKMLYEWNSYGDVSEIEYRDLVAAVRTKSRYVFEPFFVIDDEDFVEQFPQVKKFYNDNYTVSEIESILFYPVDEMEKAIIALPKGAVESLKHIASVKISNGEIDSIQKIKKLDEMFNTNLMLFTEMQG